MQNTYNIYRMKKNQLQLLKTKMELVGLQEQKTITANGYEMTFYFSEENNGNPIWWWLTYRAYFKDEIDEPKNIFHFALLVANRIAESENVYLVSLGKSHFFLSKLVEKDFGINIAIRMANEHSILLKKSRYFTGNKRQEISSYEKFVPDSYDPGESVDHLKIKAIDSEVWGDKSIVFADSIQMDIEKGPQDLSAIFEQIETTLSEEKIIKLPKLETVTDAELIRQLDAILLKALTDGDARIVVEEFEVYGIDFCFRFLNYNYNIYVKNDDGKRTDSKNLGNTLEINDVFGYIASLGYTPNIDDIKIQFKIEDKGKFTKSLKEILDFYVKRENLTYFLRDGHWYSFNQVFLEYLQKSLNAIEIEQKNPLIEDDYLKWKKDKQARISKGLVVSNKILYREYYFNEKQSNENGYELMDRVLQSIQAIEPKKRKYKLEIADLYKDEEIIAVKISEDEKELIYNIEQSKDAITLIMNGAVPNDRKIVKVALWLVFKEKIERITQLNSIQFLLAIESWQRLVKTYNLTPKIYISRHKTTI